MVDELSIESAVSLLASGDEEAPAEEAQDQEISSEPQGELDGEAEEPGDVEEAVEAEAEEPAVEAPQWWTPDKKAEFAKLTPEVQKIVWEQEDVREKVVQKAKEEAANERKAAQAEAKQFAEIAKAITEFLPKAEETFKSRWEGVDWVALARERPDEYPVYKEQYEAEQRQLAEAQQRATHAGRVAQLTKLQAEAEKLEKLAPALAGDKADENKQALAKYLTESGIDPAEIDNSAASVALAWKAYQFDRGQKALSTKPKTPAARPTVAPTAAQPRTTQQRSVEQINARLEKSGSVEDAMALIQARRRA
jgi:hypothetical protein